MKWSTGIQVEKLSSHDHQLCEVMNSLVKRNMGEKFYSWLSRCEKVGIITLHEVKYLSDSVKML